MRSRCRRLAPRIRRKECRQQRAGKSEEDEHALSCSRVIPRHLERIGDVVDQDVLARRYVVDGVGDSLRLGERGSWIGVEWLAHHEDVDLEDWLVTQDGAGRGCHVLEGRHDRLGEDLRSDDHRVPDVDELLELFSLAAVEQ